MKHIGPKLLTMVCAALMLISLMPSGMVHYSPQETTIDETFSEDLMDSYTNLLTSCIEI